MTALAIAVLLGVSVLPVFKMAGPGADTGAYIAGILTLLFSVGMIVFCWLYAPAGYELDQGKLIIRRNLGKVVFPIEEIEAVKEETAIMRRSIRTFAVGGLFGYYGSFYTDGIGKAKFFATQSRNWVWIKFQNGKNILLTPDTPAEFVRELEQQRAW